MPREPLKNTDAGAGPLFRRSGTVAPGMAKMAVICVDGQTSVDPVCSANDTFLTLTGLASSAVVGAPVANVLDMITNARLRSMIGKAMTKGRDGTWETRFRRPDGSAFAAIVSLSAIRDADQQISKSLICLLEMQATGGRDLIRQEPLHSVYEKAPGFIAMCSGPEHVFTFANASYKQFVGREDLVGLSVGEALPEMVDQGIIAVLDEVYRTGVPFLGTSMPLKVQVDVDGRLEERCIDVVYQPVHDTNGEIAGLFCEGYDVTAHHEANDALAALRSQMIYVSRVNAMGTMAATLAHELTQPLSAISNYLGGLQNSDPPALDVEHLVEALQGIEEAAERASAIVHHLRELTRPSRETHAEFELKLAVEECVRLVTAGTSLQVRFVNQVPNGLTMTADRIKIQQVVINLLLNACDAMAEMDDRVVRISAKEDDGNLVVSVTDTGPGVALEAAETIFSWTASSKLQGMGLGLSICRTILEMHRGSIWLERSGGEGSQFCFSLPLPAKVAVSCPARLAG